MPFKFNPFTHKLDIVEVGGVGPIQTITGTANRITVTAGVNPVIDIAATYVGQTSITTLGTVTTGVWNGTAVGPTFGGTGQTSYTTGDMLYASAANTLSKLPIGSTSQVLTIVGGIPAWGSANKRTITVPGAYPYTTLVTDDVIVVDTSAARTINLQAAPPTGTFFTIKDTVGTAGANNITVTPASGTIDGAASFTVASNWGSIDVVFANPNWRVL